MNKYSHFNFMTRSALQDELYKRTSFSQIAKLLGMHKTSISREVRSHIKIVKSGCQSKGYNSCKNRFTCTRNHVCHTCDSIRKFKKCRLCKLCCDRCPDYIEDPCPLLEKPPYVCNGCGKRANCTLKKHYYYAQVADEEYRKTLTESRKGFSITEKELLSLDEFVSPLIKKGQSPHHICITNPDVITVSESTIYRLVDASALGARNLDLPRKVRFHIRKCKKHKKIDSKCRIGRDYESFKKYKAEHPSVSIIELDSVEGDKGGKVLLTIHFVQSEMMLAFLRDHNDSASVIHIFDELYTKLGGELFRAIFQVCLTDNGTEFSNPTKLEYDLNGKQRTSVFYCDPGRPDQKGAAENNHTFIRRFIPKGKSLDEYTQEDIQTMMDHINSYHRENLGQRSPYEMFEFMYGSGILERLGCQPIPPQMVTLKKSVFRKEGMKDDAV